MLSKLAFWRQRQEERITLMVPFRGDDGWRDRVFVWLMSYYRLHMPENTQIVVCGDDSTPFCKTAAVNRCFDQATGDVVVILDADCYIDTDAILDCAARIRLARRQGKKLWYIPYRKFFRLTQATTERLLDRSPGDRFVDPIWVNSLDESWHEPLTPSAVSIGHWYGALIQIMPREAFIAAGRMDERFRGWGGEDISFMHAVDTMYGNHKTFAGPVYHLWHPSIKGSWAGTRQWAGQQKPEMNDWLSGKYESARGDRARMSELVLDGGNDDQRP